MEGIYRRAIYRVAGDEVFDMRVGQFSAALRALFDRERCASAAFLTAYNPRGVQAPHSANLKAQKDFRDTVRHLGYRYIPAIGLDSDPDSTWQGEPSLLILEMSSLQAEQIAHQFQQLAFVYCPHSAVPELRMLTEIRSNLDKL